MENTKLDQIKDLRQSENWCEYLEYLGWKGLKVNDLFLYLHSYGPFNLAKVQRPRKLLETDIKAIELECKKNKALFVKIEPAYSQEEDLLIKNGFKKNHFPYLPTATLIIDLSLPKEQLWKNLSHSARYSINRAKREGAKVEFYQNPTPDLISKFCELSKQSSQKKRFIDVRKVDLLKKVEIFKNSSYLIAVKNSAGEFMVADFFLVFDSNVWYMHGGTSHKARKGKWGYALIWETILYFKSQGFNSLDLEGLDDKRFPHMTKSWAGFSHFKEKFDKNKVLFPVPYIKVFNPIFKVFEKIYGNLPF